MLEKIPFKKIMESPFGCFVIFGLIILLPFIQVYFAIRGFLSDA